RRRVRYELAQAFQQGITTGDVGVIYHAAQALARKKSNYIEVIDSTQILEAALAKLSLPRDTEAYYELDRAINQLKGTPSKEVNAPPTWNHPIPWSILTRFETRPVARIQTDKGIVKLELLPELAPGSCANFIELVEQGFYDNKTWHRVVPNFVIQGGCPRGDGFGALDYSIRSELPPSYYNEAGYVGMASAGLHTEGTQFFITHSATPHLDGRYTIFARVTEGMDVVHQVLPGDAIKKITIR
ncbi:MAG: peptidylprolyl isomerase, partial [Bacteroidota bacterium]